MKNLLLVAFATFMMSFISCDNGSADKTDVANDSVVTDSVVNDSVVADSVVTVDSVAL